MLCLGWTNFFYCSNFQVFLNGFPSQFCFFLVPYASLHGKVSQNGVVQFDAFQDYFFALPLMLELFSTNLFFVLALGKRADFGSVDLMDVVGLGLLPEPVKAELL